MTRVTKVKNITGTEYADIYAHGVVTADSVPSGKVLTSDGNGDSSWEDVVSKYKSVNPQGAKDVVAANYTCDSIVTISTYTSITFVESLMFEVVFDVAANVEFNYPSSVPVIGEADGTKRRLFSFLNGTLVIGNFN